MKASSVILTLVTLVAMATGRTLFRQKRQNYDALLQNKAFVESQLNCVLSRGHCDRIGHRIKIIVPEVVRTKECKSCTDEERVNVQKVADHVKIHYPKEWNMIKNEYTPEDEEEEHLGSSEDFVADEEEEVEELEETMEPQREAKELNDNSQEDKQDFNNNFNNSYNNNNSNNNTTNISINTNSKNNTSSSQENDEIRPVSQEIDKSNPSQGTPQQISKTKVDVAVTPSPK